MEQPSQVRGFVPALEGMRGAAALGVLVTHVAFQTGAAGSPVIGRIWGRFDMAVALFFGLSGFLLWRAHAAAARGLAPKPSAKRYLLNRAARILPAYWVVVILVLLFLPQAGGGWRVWLANLGLVQVFVPLTLTDGLTQMWSLSVEVAFYLVLPLLALAMAWLSGERARYRIPVLLASTVICLGWSFLPIPTAEGTHADNWLPGYLPWFAVGMLLAELAVGPAVRWERLFANRGLMATVAITAFLLAATNLAGPAGLTRAEPWQHAVKMLLGAILAFALLAPLVLGASHRHRILESPLMLAIGRWSFGLFMWHVAILSIIFPVFGIVPFRGSFVLVLVLTIVLSIPVASASYALVEEPVRRAVKRWESRRRIGGPNDGSSDSPASESPARTDSPTTITAINPGN